jgi:hypothetical protein
MLFFFFLDTGVRLQSLSAPLFSTGNIIHVPFFIHWVVVMMMVMVMGGGYVCRTAAINGTIVHPPDQG